MMPNGAARPQRQPATRASGMPGSALHAHFQQPQFARRRSWTDSRPWQLLQFSDQQNKFKAWRGANEMERGGWSATAVQRFWFRYISAVQGRGHGTTRHDDTTRHNLPMRTMPLRARQTNYLQAIKSREPPTPTNKTTIHQRTRGYLV